MSTAAFYVLFESASGYALFSVLEAEEIATALQEVQTGLMDLSRFQRVCKMIAFHPFDTAENALENMNAVTEHEVTDDLKSFLRANLPKGMRFYTFQPQNMDSLFILNIYQSLEALLNASCSSK